MLVGVRLMEVGGADLKERKKEKNSEITSNQLSTDLIIINVYS